MWRALVVIVAVYFSPLSPSEAKSLYSRFFESPELDERLFEDTFAKVNRFAAYHFIDAYRTEEMRAVHSSVGNTSCWLRFYQDGAAAEAQALELADFKTPVFRYANWVGFCLAGDTENLATKVRLILIGSGAWKE